MVRMSVFAIYGFVLLLIVSCGNGGTEETTFPGYGTFVPGPTPTIVESSPIALAVDADPATPQVVDESIERAVGESFLIGVSFTTPAQSQRPFAGLEVEIVPSDTSVVSLGQSESSLRPVEGVPFGCGPARVVITGPEGNIHLTCTADVGTVTHEGLAWVVDATCIRPGTVTIHLVRGLAASTGAESEVEDETFGTQFLESAISWIPSALTDAHVTCK